MTDDGSRSRRLRNEARLCQEIASYMSLIEQRRRLMEMAEKFRLEAEELESRSTRHTKDNPGKDSRVWNR